MRLNVLIAVLCGYAIGLLTGLAIAGLSSGTLSQAKEENENLRTDLDAVAQKNLELSAMAEAVKDNAELIEEEAEQYRKAGVNFTHAWLKSQALIHMMRESELVADVVLRDAVFRDEFRGDWYAPAVAFEALGGHWFFEELVKTGLIPQSTLDQIDRMHPPVEPEQPRQPSRRGRDT
jgi:hypothetical protein